jgi:hypothetical protein
MCFVLGARVPQRLLIAPQIFAVQLSHFGHSCEALHLRRVVSHNAGRGSYRQSNPEVLPVSADKLITLPHQHGADRRGTVRFPAHRHKGHFCADR